MIDNDIWWVLSGEMLVDMLKEVAAGGAPALVYLEHYANADIDPDEIDGDIFE